MNKKTVALLLGLIIIISSISGVLIYFFVFKGYLPTCVDKPFTDYPVDMDKITSIVPLGNLNPPGHTFPTDHMYFFTDTMSNPDGFEVFAPGDIIIERISKVDYDPPQGNITEDYTIEFLVCRNVWGRFGHINNISDTLWDHVIGFGIEYGDSVNFWQVAGINYTSYQKQVNIAMNGGQILGIAGKGGGYDFWLKDDRVQLTWVNQDWTQEFRYTVCPLSYFQNTLKEVMQNKLKTWGGEPVYPANYCGRINFDFINAAQGIWTKVDYVNRVEDYGLALVYSNFNASLGAISIGLAGNSSWDSHVYHFTPEEDGLKNRKFDEVISDGNVYYYFCNEFYSGLGFTKVILLKMTAYRELRLQFIDNGGVFLPDDPRSLWNETISILYVR